MDAKETQQARVRALGDQVVSSIRTNLEDLKRIVDSDPSTWSAEDIQIIKGTIAGTIGMYYEGRLG